MLKIKYINKSYLHSITYTYTLLLQVITLQYIYFTMSLKSTVMDVQEIIHDHYEVAK